MHYGKYSSVSTHKIKIYRSVLKTSHGEFSFLEVLNFSFVGLRWLLHVNRQNHKNKIFYDHNLHPEKFWKFLMIFTLFIATLRFLTKFAKNVTHGVFKKFNFWYHLWDLQCLGKKSCQNVWSSSKINFMSSLWIEKKLEHFLCSR